RRSAGESSRNVPDFRWPEREPMNRSAKKSAKKLDTGHGTSQRLTFGDVSSMSTVGMSHVPCPIFLRHENVRRSREAGVATVYFVLFTVVILGFVTFATDVGRMYLIQGELQNAADAAALAAALRLNGTSNALTHADDSVTASFDSTTGNDNRFNLRQNSIE